MTFVPEKPRSELVTPAKCSGDGVCETLRRFQIASPASCRPAFSPTRGSGDGAAISGRDMSGAGSELALGDIDVDDELAAHPATSSDAATDAIADLAEVNARGIARAVTVMFYLLSLREVHPASAACGRSRCSDLLVRRSRT